jgi:hypothetical protein
MLTDMQLTLASQIPGWQSFLFFCAIPIVLGGSFFLCLKKRAVWFGGWPAGVRTVFFNVLALAFFGSTVFLAFESYYRFIYDTTDSFNYTYTSKRWFMRYFQYNSADLRDNINYPEDIPSGHRRVTILGDSFTVGQGVKNVDDRFANILRKRHPDWDVQVLAVEGLDTGPEIEALKRLTNHNYQMDLVVLVYCLNDIVDLMPEWNKQMFEIFKDWDSRNWLVKHSYFANTYYYRLKARLDPNIPNYFNVVRDGYTGKLWEIQKLRLAAMRQLVESSGGRFAVVTFPFLHVMGPKYDYQFVHDQLDKFWIDSHVPHLDLLPIYRNYEPAKIVINKLDAHPNEFAHSLAADAIDPFIVEQLKSSAPPKK